MKIPRDKDIHASIKRSIADIGLNYVDLFLIHTPTVGPDGRAAIWQSLVDVQAEGLIRSIGVSNL